MFRLAWCTVRRCYAIYTLESAAKEAGAFVESHEVVTEDGYKLRVDRLKGDAARSVHGTPVLLQHGLWTSSDDWAVNGPEKSLPFSLYRSGFDVWLGNSRGNARSTGHLKLSRNDKEYWDFSWHEIGVFDLPATVDLVTGTSGRRQVYYVGHSQGTTAFFVMAATRPEYNAKIRAMIALSPVACLENISSPLLKALSERASVIWKVFLTAGMVKLLPSEALMNFVQERAKSSAPIAAKITKIFVDDLSSYASKEVKENFKEILVNRMKTGTPLKSIVHYAQCMQSRGGFRHFDYGSRKNLELYRNAEAPPYDLGRSSAPVVAFWSQGDWVSSRNDLDFLRTRLSSFLDEEVMAAGFNHQDFMWADLYRFGIIHKILNYLFLYGKIS